MSDGNENVVKDDATEGLAPHDDEPLAIKVDPLGGVHLCAADRKRLLRIESLCRSVLVSMMIRGGKVTPEEAAKQVEAFLNGEPTP